MIVTMQSDFVVKQGTFEGPLPVLLSFIEKRKLFINDISLGKVTDDFLAYVRNLEKFPIALSASFVLVASTLVLIKSKSLLPQLALSEEEQGDIYDLERRLKIYKRIREASANVKTLFGVRVLFPLEPRPVQTIFTPGDSMTLSSLLLAVKDVLRNLPKVELLPKAVVIKVLSLEEMIGNLTARITSSLRMSFREFSKSHKDNKANVIVSFLAMLELVKQGVISVTQREHFEEIIMETDQIGVPKY